MYMAAQYYGSVTNPRHLSGLGDTDLSVPLKPSVQKPARRAALGRLSGALLLVAVLAAMAAVPTAVALTAGTHWADAHDAALPPQLVTPPDAQATRIYASDGTTLITTFYDEDRHDVGLAQIAPAMQKAIVAAEDTRFFQHGGVDVKGVLRALVSNSRSGHTEQGASTLTMQYVRNVLKEDPDLSAAAQKGATADTLSRKLREAQYAIELEQRLSKTQILQNYLNIVYFGDGAYGIDAASRRFFDVAPDKLDLAQAALLAGIVQSPDGDNPATGSKTNARIRQLYVLAAMAKSGAITPAQQAAAAAEKLKFRTAVQPNGCTEAAGGSAGWGFYCDYLRRWWDTQPAFGATAEERDLALRRGGYRVVTSLNPDIQREAAKQSRTVYSDGNRKALPIAVVQPGTGKVLALAVNRQYGTAHGETVNPLITGGGSLHGYPAGSTFKMFTMLAALQDGMPLNTGFNAPAKLPTEWPATGPGTCGGRYCPGNDNPAWMDGFRTMWDGFGRSVNTYFVHLEEQVGPGAAVAEAKKLGISFSAPSDAKLAETGANEWGSFTLGVVDTTPLELAEAYATVASGGTYCKPLPVNSITDAQGKAVPVGPQCSQVIDPDIAHAAADAARCPVGQQSTYGKCNGGTAQQVAAMFTGGRQVAGKTGSTENNTTETFVGFTTSMAAAGTAADPADPNDHVGSAVESRVVDAVGHTLRAAVGDSAYPDFTPPSAAIALGG
jgi:membrane peptidoglycan carboxypeptidase